MVLLSQKLTLFIVNLATLDGFFKMLPQGGFGNQKAGKPELLSLEVDGNYASFTVKSG